MGRFSGLVAELERCAEVGRRAYEQAGTADGQACAGDFAELSAALARADRAVQAASVAAVAQFARREQVQDPDDVAGTVEKVHGPGFVEEFASTELALVLGVSTRSADTRLDHAAELVRRLPRVLATLAQGLVELGQVHRVLYEIAEVDDEQDCAAIDAYLAARIGTCDPTRLVTLTRYAIGRICPGALRARAVKNTSDRYLDVGPGPAGTAEVRALVPAAQGAAIWEAACELARTYQQDDPTLSLAQARADAFVDLVLADVDVTARLDLGVPVLSSTTTNLGDAPHSGDAHESGDAQETEPVGAEPEPEPGPVADPAGPGRDLVSAQDAAAWEERRDVDHDPWFARYRTDPEPASDAAAPGADAAAPADAAAAAAASAGAAAETRGAAATGATAEAEAVAVPEAFRPPGPGACAPTGTGVAISGVYLPKVGYLPPDVVAGLLTQVGTQIGLAMLDASTGTLLHTIHDAYRPSAAMRHFITIRDRRCRMFGCQLSAQHWDLDHAIAHPAGATTPPNLAGLCRRHHRAKQHRDWRYHLLPDGTATWQSPTGAIRVTYPEHHLPPPPQAQPPEASQAASAPPGTTTADPFDAEPPF